MYQKYKRRVYAIFILLSQDSKDMKVEKSLQDKFEMYKDMNSYLVLISSDFQIMNRIHYQDEL